MKDVLHLIADDLDSLENMWGWATWDIVDEHWLWLWEGILDG